MTIEKLTECIVNALEDIKAKNIEVLQVDKLTSLCDIMIIASGDSTRQTKALARNVEKECLMNHFQVHGVEGEASGEWILVDCGSVIVHIMQPAIRDYYNLSELWGAVTTPPAALKAKRAL